MVELRWLVNTQTQNRVLQYRTLKEQVVYSGSPDVDRVQQRRESVWTEWRDVPEVKS